MVSDGDPMQLGEDGFQCAPALRMDAQRRISKLQYETLKERLQKIEATLERLERRLWLTVYGVVAAVLAEAIVPVLMNLH